ncbi:MAG TPA: hypothetical protein ENO23_06780 [Alphaproteobacteria bacterium]|nr:hypothetical protein [Alphaproteobacteria bacterium]
MPSPGSRRALAVTLVLGAASAGLYLLLYLFADTLPALAAAARQGDKLYAVIPIVIAIVFSLVHGAFTGRFWDLLGLRAKKK